MSNIIDLAVHRRAPDAAPPTRTIPVTSEPDPDDPNRDWHLIVNEDRDVVAAGIRAVEGHVESFGSGGEAHTHVFRRMGQLYFAIVETIRYPEGNQ